MKSIDNDTIESDFEGARLAPELQSIAEFARWAWRIRKSPLAVVIIVWAFLFLVLGLASAFAQTQQRPLTAQHTKDGRDGRPALKRGDSTPPDEEGDSEAPQTTDRQALKRRNDAKANSRNDH